MDYQATREMVAKIRESMAQDEEFATMTSKQRHEKAIQGYRDLFGGEEPSLRPIVHPPLRPKQ